MDEAELLLDEELQFTGSSSSNSFFEKMTTEIPVLVDTGHQRLHFATIDYIIFSSMLVMSAVIGVYFGFISKRKQNNMVEYILGGRNMGAIPISASLIASHISGVTLLGVPAEMYARGTQYWLHVISVLAVALLMSYVYLPVFYELQLTSSFTYLERRFDRSVRLFASFVYALSCIIFIPIVIYVPALAFSQVTGINLHLITPIISLVCIFYTTVGGLRAVVWTDTLQFILMTGSTVAVIILGILAVGGFVDVWKTADRGGRLIFFNMDPDPTVRVSFWTVSIGLTTTWISQLGVTQSSIQRFLAVPNITVARRSVWIFAFGLLMIKACSCFIGLLIYAEYEKCDPLSTGAIQKLDQILPYYVMNVAGNVPGLPGLFIAGIFSAALSSMSSSLNTLAGSIYEDFLEKFFPDKSERTASNVMKALVVILGFIVLSLVFVCEYFDTVFSMTLSLAGLTAGTLLGIFTMGMCLPKTNKIGVMTGAVSSMLLILSMIIGSHMMPIPEHLSYRTDGCEGTLTNTTIFTVLSADASHVPWLFRVSMMYYSFIGFMVVLIIGYPVSLLTGGGENEIDDELLSPFCRSKKYRKKHAGEKRGSIYYAGIAQPYSSAKLVEQENIY